MTLCLWTTNGSGMDDKATFGIGLQRDFRIRGDFRCSTLNSGCSRNAPIVPSAGVPLSFVSVPVISIGPAEHGQSAPSVRKQRERRMVLPVLPMAMVPMGDTLCRGILV